MLNKFLKYKWSIKLFQQTNYNINYFLQVATIKNGNQI